MSSTYLSLHYHIVFGTKDRMPLIDASWRPRLHEYLGGIVHGLGGTPESIGGVADHIHLLVGLKSTHCLADFVRDLKKGGYRMGSGNHSQRFQIHLAERLRCLHRQRHLTASGP